MTETKLFVCAWVEENGKCIPIANTVKEATEQDLLENDVITRLIAQGRAEGFANAWKEWKQKLQTLIDNRKKAQKNNVIYIKTTDELNEDFIEELAELISEVPKGEKLKGVDQIK